MANYLDENGLTYVWSKIKGMFAPLASPALTGTPTAPTPATSDDSTKIATTAYVNNVVSGLEGATYTWSQDVTDPHDITMTGSNGYSKTITTADTTYSAATTTSDGLMSSTDKGKLNDIASGAQVNVIESIKIGTDSALTPSSKAVTIPIATDSVNGAMSSTDYSKLSNIAAGAQVNVIESIKIGTDSALTPSSKAITIPMANTTTNGAMSASDYSKLADFQAASNYALKSDITGVYKYKGSVATEAALPSTGQTTGDVYDIQAASSYGAAGMNVAWNGTGWDALGGLFSIASITNAQIDTICV